MGYLELSGTPDGMDNMHVMLIHRNARAGFWVANGIDTLTDRPIKTFGVYKIPVQHGLLMVIGYKRRFMRFIRINDYLPNTRHETATVGNEYVRIAGQYVDADSNDLLGARYLANLKPAIRGMFSPYNTSKYFTDASLPAQDVVDPPQVSMFVKQRKLTSFDGKEVNVPVRKNTRSIIL